MTHSRSGFTLFELSIVILIIGAIAGGIIGGKSMIRASQLRSVATTLTEYRTAISNFKLKYDALPGDMTNATTYWGKANAVQSTCEVTLGTGTQTCDGNGDGFIRGNANGATESEKFRMWQHLALAGMITGIYTGTGGTGNTGTYALPGTNVPVGPLPNSGFSMGFGFDYVASANYFPSQYGNVINFGAPCCGVETYVPILLTEEARAIDVKMDDGKPGQGAVMTYAPGAWWAGSCTTSTNPMVADYDLTQLDPACALIFKIAATSQ